MSNSRVVRYVAIGAAVLVAVGLWLLLQGGPFHHGFGGSRGISP
jgi:hypothetical protein